MQQSIRRLFAIVMLTMLFLISQAQPEGSLPEKIENKPYKILVNGKQITIKSTKEIKHVMLWTTSGNRVVEQKEINKGSFTFYIPVNQKTFFMMIGLVGGKVYTEKMGIQ